jgi:hypothetical protein
MRVVAPAKHERPNMHSVHNERVKALAAALSNLGVGAIWLERLE